jgi:transcriptional regulator with XRE-family HTH domain
MGRRRKTPIDGEREEMIARRNIEARLAVMFPRATGPTQQYEGLKKLSSVGEETIRRFMTGQSSMTLRNLQAIAQALGLTIVELFTEESAPTDGPQAGDDRGSGSLQRR